MNSIRPPMNAMFRNTLIMITSGVVASLLSVTVYGATLPVDEPTEPVSTAAVVAATADAAAAASLRAMLAAQRLVVVAPAAADQPSR
jgi:hypothetical protein